MVNSKAGDQWPVLIVGAGPVGLLLANLLGGQGISCLVIEQRGEDIGWSRAIGITPPSLDIFRQAGLEQVALAQGVQVRQAAVYDDRGRAGEVAFTDIPSDFPFILTLPQAQTIKIMGASLQRYPCVVVRRGHQLLDLTQTAAAVQALVRDTRTNEEIHVAAQWIIGCDGADSSVRALAGIPFKRGSYAPEFVMADYEDNGSCDDQARLFFTRHGSLESFPLPRQQRRWIAQLDRRIEQSFHQEFLERRVADIAEQPLSGKPGSPVFNFVPQKIMVKRLFQARALLAGDAGHVFSPIGGQGMNTGFADAEFLAVIMRRLLDRNEDADRLLASYSRHRLRAAGIARRRAAWGMWVGTRQGGLASAVRSRLFRTLLLRPPLAGKLPPYFAMLTIPRNVEPQPCRNLT